MPRKSIGQSEFRAVIQAEREKLEEASRSGETVMLSLSGGAASAVAAHRALEWWDGRVRLVFADTCSEDEDTYRFLDDCEAKFGPIVRLRQFNDDGSPMDIWDCFDKHGIMCIPKAGNACKASVELKQKPLDAYAAENDIRLLAVGYGFTELERMLKLNSKKVMTVVYPLVADPLLSDCEIIEELKRIGLAPPAIYEDGFVHNNCLGSGGCVLAGLAQFAAVKKLKPDAFEYARERSQAFYERTGFSVLRDQRQGDVKPYTLNDLVRDMDSGRDFGNEWQSNCSCMGSLFSTSELVGL